MSTNQLSRSGVFGPERLFLTLGIVLAVSLVAFDALALVTIAPELTRALAGRALYGWLFSGFFLASILGTALAGPRTDRYGPQGCLRLGLGTFALGLLTSGFAPSMWVLLLGRALQGFGSGVLLTALYVVVNLSYDDSKRSRIFALMSSAWVIPALVGPVAAGFLISVASWRWVFLGLVPFCALVALSVLRNAPDIGDQAVRSPSRLWAASRLVLGSTLLLVALSQGFVVVTALLAVIGFGVALSGLGPLLPKGTLSVARGLPAAIVVHGLVFGAFSTVEAYLALALTRVVGVSTVVAGVVIAVAAVSWSAGTWLQDGLDDSTLDKRQARAWFGGALLVLGIASQAAALYAGPYALALSLLGWSVGGLGMGLAHTATLVLVQRYAPSGAEGATSSAMVLFEQLTFALSAGVGGALLGLAQQLDLAERSGLVFVFGLSLLLACGALAGARRLRV